MFFLSVDINQMLVCSLLLICGVAHHYHNLYWKKTYFNFSTNSKLNNTITNKTFSIKVTEQPGILREQSQIHITRNQTSLFAISTISKSSCIKTRKAISPLYVYLSPTTTPLEKGTWERGAAAPQSTSQPTLLAAPNPLIWHPYSMGHECTHTQFCAIVLGKYILKILRWQRIRPITLQNSETSWKICPFQHHLMHFPQIPTKNTQSLAGLCAAITWEQSFPDQCPSPKSNQAFCYGSSCMKWIIIKQKNSILGEMQSAVS